MTRGRKRVILRAMVVLVTVLVIIVLVFLPGGDPRQAKARRLVAELRGEPAGRVKQWLIDHRIIDRAPPRRSFFHIQWDLIKLGPWATPALADALADKDSNVRYEAVLVLSNMRNDDAKAATPALANALADTYAGVRRNAAVALARIGPQAIEAAPALIQAMKHTDGITRQYAAWALREIGARSKETISVLVESLEDKDIDVRLSAALALIKLENPDGAEQGLTSKAFLALIAQLEDEDADHRGLVAGALGKVGAPAKPMIPALMEALKDEDERVRCDAAGALVKLGLPDKGLPVLIAGLEDGPWLLRMQVAMTLAEIGVPAEPAIPALRKALNDKDEAVRRAAAGALKRIQADGSRCFDRAQHK